MNKLILVIFFLSSFAFGQNCLSLADLTQQAKTEDRQILLYFSGSDWCKPCMLLKETVLETEEFKKEAKEKYIVANYDFPQNLSNISQEEMSCREQMAEQFNANGMFPKLVLIDQNGFILEEINGYRKQTPKEILSQLTTK